MEMRTFGRTGMQVSLLGFGCGAVGGLMCAAHGGPERAVARALRQGSTIDTAAMYGNGESEKNLGRVLAKLKPALSAPGPHPVSRINRIGAAVAGSTPA